MKNRFIKLLLAAVLLGSLSPAAAQTREMDLSGEWRFQTDVKIGRASCRERV